MIGIRSALLTATKGTVVMDTVFDSYRPVVGVINQRNKGSLLAFEDGTANPFGIQGAQDRGLMFITTKDDVYKVKLLLCSFYVIMINIYYFHFLFFVLLLSFYFLVLLLQDMIIGVHQRPGDLAVNVCKTKALTNMRAAGSDDTVKVISPLYNILNDIYTVCMTANMLDWTAL